MILKLKKISMASFVKIFATLNVLAGFILGTIVTLISLVVPDEQGPGGVGAWAILLFPVFNGLLGLLTGMFLTGMYNFLVKFFGGIELEFENENINLTLK